MAIVTDNPSAGSRGHKCVVALTVDTTARTVLANATHTKMDGTDAIGPPQKAVLHVLLTTGADQPFDLLTVVAPSDGQPGILNKGDELFTNISVKQAVSRAGNLDCWLEYLPPVGA